LATSSAVAVEVLKIVDVLKPFSISINLSKNPAFVKRRMLSLSPKGLVEGETEEVVADEEEVLVDKEVEGEREEEEEVEFAEVASMIVVKARSAARTVGFETPSSGSIFSSILIPLEFPTASRFSALV
jgi:hypothetical protein